MSAVLLRLPSDVLVAHVFTMLGIVDMVNLDTAACSLDSRRDLNRGFSAAPVIDLRDSIYPLCYSSSIIVWKWFWKRHMSIKGIQADCRWVKYIEKNIHFVTCPLNIRFGEAFGGVSKGSIADFPAVLAKMDCITFVGQVNTSDLAALSPRMLSLTSIVDESNNLSEDDIVRLIHPQLLLKELKLNSNFGSRLLNAILPMGPTLRSLVFKTSTLQEVHYKLIAQHCPHLTTFHLTEFEGIPTLHAGVAAIAKSCRKLQDVRIFIMHNIDDFLLLFAQHCPELRKVDFKHRTGLTAAALNALAINCSHLQEVTADWNVNSVETVHNAAALLARLKKITLNDRNRDRQTLPTALQFLRDVEFLHLSGLAIIDAKTSSAMARRCTQLRSLTGDYLTEECIATVARSNPKLEIVIWRGMTNEDLVVEAIAESCSRLRHLECCTSCSRTPSQLTDRALVKLAKGCPKLLRLKNCSGPDITDVSVLALAQHCHYLKEVDLMHSTRVTEEALVKLVERTALVIVKGFSLFEYARESFIKRWEVVVCNTFSTNSACLIVNASTINARALERIQRTGSLKLVQDPLLAEHRATLNKGARELLQQKQKLERHKREWKLSSVSHLFLAGLAVGVLGSFVLFSCQRRY